LPIRSLSGGACVSPHPTEINGIRNRIWFAQSILHLARACSYSDAVVCKRQELLLPAYHRSRRAPPSGMYLSPLRALLLATLVPLGHSISTDTLIPFSVTPPVAPQVQVGEDRPYFGYTHDQVPILQAPKYDNTTSLYIHRSFCGSLFVKLYRCPIVGPNEIHRHFCP
jgi:hypothetical protein